MIRKDLPCSINLKNGNNYLKKKTLKYRTNKIYKTVSLLALSVSFVLNYATTKIHINVVKSIIKIAFIF